MTNNKFLCLLEHLPEGFAFFSLFVLSILWVIQMKCEIIGAEYLQVPKSTEKKFIYFCIKNEKAVNFTSSCGHTLTSISTKYCKSIDTCTYLCLSASAFPSVIPADSTHTTSKLLHLWGCVYANWYLCYKSNWVSDLPPSSGSCSCYCHKLCNAAIYTFLIIRHKKCLQVCGISCLVLSCAYIKSVKLFGAWNWMFS